MGVSPNGTSQTTLPALKGTLPIRW